MVRKKAISGQLSAVSAVVLGLVMIGAVLARDPVPGRGVMETGTNVISGAKFFLNGLWIGTNAQVTVNASNQLVSVVNGVTNLLGGSAISTNDILAIGDARWLLLGGTASVSTVSLGGWPTQWAGGSITSTVANATTATVWTAEASKLSTNYNGAWLVGSGGSTNITGGGTWTLSSGVWTYAPTGITTAVQSALDGKLNTNGVAQSSVTASNVVPLLDWVATNNTTSVVSWAWPADVSNIIITASAYAFSDRLTPNDTLVLTPLPAVNATNLFRLREVYGSTTSLSVDYASGTTVLGIGSISGTNGFVVNGYRLSARGRYARTNTGFTFDTLGATLGNGATNSYSVDRRSGNWFGGTTTNLSFSVLLGVTFGSNSWIRITRE
jgi:hypothetical protein